MITNIPKPVDRDKIHCTCMNCCGELEEGHFQFIIEEMGYASSFDTSSFDSVTVGLGIVVNLCHDCYESSPKYIWDSNKIQNEQINGDYLPYEDELWFYIDNMDIRGRELCLNTIPQKQSIKFDPQDYIRYEMGLPLEDKELDQYINWEINWNKE